MPLRARIYIALVIAAALVICATAVSDVHLPATAMVLVYLTLSAAAGLLKVRLPGISGTYSVAFLPVLVGIAYLDLPTTLLSAALSSAVQTLVRTQKRPTVAQLAFNIGNLFISIAAA